MNNGHDSDYTIEPDPSLRHDADQGREPQLVPGLLGRRMVSLAALLERIEAAFYAEHGEDSALLRELDTEAQRRRLVLDTTEYVLAVESVHLDQNEKAELLRRAYSNIFGYGPLDACFADPRITTVLIEGVDRVGVRIEHGEIVSLGPLFEDHHQLNTIVRRLLRDANAELREDAPVLEAGLQVNGRAACISLAAPPVAQVLSADIRLHPREPLSLDELTLAGFLTETAASLLRALAGSSYGVMVVGEAESGKTTLLGALARLVNDRPLLAVERAGELSLAADVERLSVRWPVGDRPGVTFGEQIEVGLAREPACLVLDEVRADEPFSIAPLLEREVAPRQLWAFRGAPDAKRLQSGLGMLARRAAPGQGEALVHALYERLPFVVTVARIRERLQVFSVAEWQPNPTSDYPDYVTLLRYQDGDAQPTGAAPVRGIGWANG